jgi:hypothetical protein
MSAVIVERYFISEEPEFKKSSICMEQILEISKMVKISSVATGLCSISMEFKY